ncbi:restriction endonuclease [Chryseobacterium sp.]|uniref:restriction endonuclease n=1 Tax=Chryseobacterium sp. TaxID=1871047 RepID=UPI0023F1727E|nr:restriction endonuclease [Chryseobacterium sp.]
MAKDGKNLEKLVRIVEEVYKTNPNTKVHSNYKIPNESGNKREIDVLIESTINNFEIKIAIECKEYKAKVSVEKIEAFNSKCQRIPSINKKIFVSQIGFQKDAIDAAKNFGISLYTFDDIQSNASDILFPISRIKPVFLGFELLDIYCEENPRLSEIRIKSVQELQLISASGKKLVLYDLLEEAVKPNWKYVSGQAFNNWLKDNTTQHKIQFAVNCEGIFFEYEDEKITINQFICNAKINFEFISPEIQTKEYRNFSNGEIKAQTVSFFDGEHSGSIVIDDVNKVHFFDTSNNKIKELKLLAKYDKNTDTFETFD